jgi:signal transduction histidine kinase
VSNKIKLSSKFKKFFLLILLAQAILLSAGGYFYFHYQARKAFEQDSLRMSSVEQTYIDELIVQKTINNQVAFDLLMYKLIEIQKVDHVSFYPTLEALSLDNSIAQRDCEKGERAQVCYNEEIKTIHSIFPLSIDGENLGFIHLRKKIIDNTDYFQKIFKIFILITSILVALNFLAFYYLFSKLFKKELSQLGDLLEDDSLTDKVSFKTYEFDQMRAKLKKYIDERKASEEKFKRVYSLEQLEKLSHQVAHDIRSPIAALSVLSSSATDLKEENRQLLKTAISRINDIANNLSLKKNRSMENQPKSIQLLSSIINSIVSEKRAEYWKFPQVKINHHLDPSNYGLFAKVAPAELKRVFSNLINNAVESFDNHQGQIGIYLSSFSDRIFIQVADNGKGIPSDKLPHVFERGISFGKTTKQNSGEGLGLSHAKEAIESMGGEISIQSTREIGTNISIQIPKASAPEWFVPSIEVKPRILVLDDDESIHKVWESRLSPFNIEISHQTDPDHFLLEQEEFDFYLIDYEFSRHELNGLDLIQKKNLQEKSILVTSHFEEEDIVKRCQSLKVKLLPKELAGYVPLTFLQERSTREHSVTPSPLLPH